MDIVQAGMPCFVELAKLSLACSTGGERRCVYLEFCRTSRHGIAPTAEVCAYLTSLQLIGGTSAFELAVQYVCANGHPSERAGDGAELEGAIISFISGKTAPITSLSSGDII